MEKPPSDGMAFLESKYGSIDTPPDKFKANQIRVFLAEDFEAGRPMPNEPYERRKRPMYGNSLTTDEWQQRCKEKAQRCEV